MFKVNNKDNKTTSTIYFTPISIVDFEKANACRVDAPESQNQSVSTKAIDQKLFKIDNYLLRVGSNFRNVKSLCPITARKQNWITILRNSKIDDDKVTLLS